jgi:hypothetical protein
MFEAKPGYVYIQFLLITSSPIYTYAIHSADVIFNAEAINYTVTSCAEYTTYLNGLAFSSLDIAKSAY